MVLLKPGLATRHGGAGIAVGAVVDGGSQW